MLHHVAIPLQLAQVMSIALLMTGPVSRVMAQDGEHARIVDTAKAYFTEHFPDDAQRFEVRVLRFSGAIPTSEPIRIALPAATTLPRAHTQVKILSGDGRDIGHAMLYVAHFDSLIVARSRIAPDGIVSEGEITVAWMETTRMHGTPLRASDFRQMLSTGPVHARRLIREGQVFRTSDVRAAYAVETGDPVLMTYGRGQITLKLSCSAREPGTYGDVIRVYNSDTSTMYRARLTGPGRAVWIETL